MTKGTPQQIVQDPVAIREYLGAGFTEDPFSPSAMPAPVAAERVEETVVTGVVEQEKIHRLIEALKSPDQSAAAQELVQRGEAALPALLERWKRATSSLAVRRPR